ncbi:DUF4118 domain-containing protein, partial [Pyxidicoccus fallax]
MRPRSWPAQILGVVLLLGVCVAVSFGLDPLSRSAPFPIFLAGILAAAWMGGRVAALGLTALSTVALGMLFIHPRGELFAYEPGEAVLLVTFTFVGGFISVAVGSLREAHSRAEQLRQLADAFARASTPAELAVVARQQARWLLGAPVATLWTVHGEQGPEAARPILASPDEPPPSENFTALAGLSLRSGAPFWPRGPDPGQPYELALALRGSHQVLGTLVLRLPGRRPPGPRRRRLALALAETCAAALERVLLQERVLGERRMLEAVISQAPVGVIVAEAPSSRILLYN